jgi:N-acylneuraminate cytidylyltransferase
MRIFAFIFARGGSKGVPGKNIKDMCGKPLIAYSIEIAQAIDSIDKIFVSTEDDNIATIAKKYGADIIPRPHNLAQDDSSEWLAWQHAVKWLGEKGESFDIFVSLPTTSPLRNKKDIINCLNALNNYTDIVVSMTESQRNPRFNMVEKQKDGFLKLVIEGDTEYQRRQDVPVVYDLTTVAYVTRPEFIKRSKGIFDGRISGVEIPSERAIDIDTELDFKIAEYLMGKRISKI